MKKKSVKTARPKEFTTSPFAALKGVKAETEVSTAKPQPKPAPAANVERDDDMFLRAMADVQRLHDVRRPTPANAPPPAAKPMVRRIEEEEQQVFLQALTQLKLDVTFREETAEEDTPIQPRGQNRLRQLRRGTIRIDYELDLHGLTRDEAIEALEAFIGGAFRRGQQAVLVITGKGNNSPGEPVLFGAVREWLRSEGRGMVSETVAAPKQMGGDGAVVVFIRSGGGNG